MQLSKMFFDQISWTAVVSLGITANLVTFLVMPGSPVRYFIASTIIFTILVCVYSVTLSLLDEWKRRDKHETEFRATTAELSELSADQVRTRALSLLEDPHLYRTNKSPDDGPRFGVLGPSLDSLFREYEWITDPEERIYIGRNRISASRFRGGSIKIGEDFEGNELVVSPGNDQIDQVDESGGTIDKYRSIFHLIIMGTGGPSNAR